MIPTESLFEVIENEGICAEYLDLPMGFIGFYLVEYRLPYPHVGLENSLLCNERLHRCVIAHELGHHFKATGGSVLAASSGGTTFLYYLSKTEKLANDWAVDKLVPTDAFLQMVADKRSLDEIADYFYVIPEFVLFRAKSIWKNGIRDGKLRPYLNLEEERMSS